MNVIKPQIYSTTSWAKLSNHTIIIKLNNTIDPRKKTAYYYLSSSQFKNPQYKNKKNIKLRQ